jgi:hypothetical protein
MDNQKNIIICKGDATIKQTNYKTYIIHCCNNKRKWGAGFVLALNKQYPLAKTKYMNGSMILGSYTIADYDDVKIVNIIGQDSYGNSSKTGIVYVNYDALKSAFHDIANMIKNEILNNKTDYMNSSQVNNYEKIVIQCPRLGCGLAGGNWSIVQSLLSIFIENNIDVIVCDF